MFFFDDSSPRASPILCLGLIILSLHVCPHARNVRRLGQRALRPVGVRRVARDEPLARLRLPELATKYENWAVTKCLQKYIESRGCPATLDARWIYLHCWVCMRLIGKMYSSLLIPRQFLTHYMSNKHPLLAEITADEINALEEQMFLFFMVALEDGPLANGLRSLGDSEESDSDGAGCIY